MKIDAVADEEMVKNAVGENEYDALAVPPNADVDLTNEMARKAVAALREVFDPEIPVNIYELGLIYKIDIIDIEGSKEVDVYVEMSLTSPACPVAQEMPGMVQSAIFPIENIRHVDVDIVWDPTWDPSMMAETAKLQLNMFT
ncbi:MAG: DUF59 domain-containing protein [Alphaproteobacteria bacterium]|nr:DUF59 domain-containing protein [Alphaproteobacteria bacterium]